MYFTNLFLYGVTHHEARTSICPMGGGRGGGLFLWEPHRRSAGGVNASADEWVNGECQQSKVEERELDNDYDRTRQSSRVENAMRERAYGLRPEDHHLCPNEGLFRAFVPKSPTVPGVAQPRLIM